MECIPASRYAPHLLIAIEAAKLAGEIIMKASKNKKEITTKSGDVDLVTATDKEAEEIIAKHVQAKKIHLIMNISRMISYLQIGVYGA